MTKESAPVPGLRPRLRLPIWTILVVGFGGLVLAAVASVLIVGVTSLGRSTLVLLGDKANLALDNVAIRVSHQFDPISDQSRFLADMIASGEIDMTEPEAMGAAFRSALAATPQVTGISYSDLDLNAVRVGRFGDELLIYVGNLSDVDGFQEVSDEAVARGAPFWADPEWEPQLEVTVISLRQAVRRDGVVIGVLMFGVSIGDLSRFLSDLFVETGLDGFLIYDDEYVLAHRSLPDLTIDLSQTGDRPPLPRIGQLGDPILATALSPAAEPELIEHELGDFIITGAGGDDDDGGGDGPEHLILMRPVPAYGSGAWTLGVSFPAKEIEDELLSLFRAVAVSLAILVVSVVAALLIALPTSRKISQIAAAAKSLGTLDVDQVSRLPDSRIREIANATAAFNAMVAGLRWFEAYVPKSLVLRMIRGGVGASVTSEEREVTVMFTDIMGFSGLAEPRSAAETASLLNRHFAVISACVEEEGGTVDKYMGDGLMAFWGAPEDQPDHAARAVRAALAIARAVARACDDQRRAGEPPVRIRIGLHTGVAVVGNIGSPSRYNYTTVGDTVNAAARIEAFGVSLQEGVDAVVLASVATIDAAGTHDADAVGPVESAGTPTLRGRISQMEVFLLTGWSASDAGGETGPSPDEPCDPPATR